MLTKRLFPITEALTLLMAAGCGTAAPAAQPAPRHTSAPTYAREAHLGMPAIFHPTRPPVAGHGDPTDHPCLRGDYLYSWTGGGQVLLCCIPPDEILSGRVHCSGLNLPSAPPYFRLATCSLQHPTATKPTFVHVCIPAPLTAPQLTPR